MTEAIRLTERHAFYDELKTHTWREWPAGAIVTDPDVIKLIKARGAPFEIIETSEFGDQK